MTHGRKPIPPEVEKEEEPFDLDFEPVPVRERFDGWTPEKQTDFIEALAESGCVDHACARVGMSSTSAYTLRRRVDAQAFRMAWESAIDYAIRKLSDAALSRAIHGVSRPVFYKGEQVGERRYYDERLAMFMLRYRDPVRYGAWLDKMEAQRHPDGAAINLTRAVDLVAEDAWAEVHGAERREREPLNPDPHVMNQYEVQEAWTERNRQQRERDQQERERAAEDWRSYTDDEEEGD